MRPLFPVLLLLLLAAPARAQDFSVLADPRPPEELPQVAPLALPAPSDAVRVLVVGDSWAQYMWDDGSHNDVLDRFGYADHQALSLSLGSDPGPGYTGPEVAISGSEARQWADTANYPWIANMVALLQAHPTIDLVMLSIGGNDVLAGKSDDGWYKDMDLDVPGSEEALFQRIHDDTFAIIDAALAVRPAIRVLLSSYDYPNFNTGIWCFLYACPKRRDLSRDPTNDLITDAELNAMMITVEQQRIGWVAEEDRLLYDNSVGLMHHIYGDGVTGPRLLPRPGVLPPDYLPFPGGNPLLPTLRSNFRLAVDPIHLSFDGYQHKIAHQTEGSFLPLYRGLPTLTVLAKGGDEEGWTDGVGVGTTELRVGDDGARRVAAILSFDIPYVADLGVVLHASLHLTRKGASGVNPFTSGALGSPSVDVKAGFFGSSATLEPEDLTAPADAEGAGWAVGSVRANAYTLRVELDEAGCAALSPDGPTQIRLSFPVADATADWISFHDGDAGVWTPSGVATFAEVVGTAKPVLDLHHGAPSAVEVATLPARLLQNRPNPFNPRTVIELDLQAAGWARLAVYDLRGRRVRLLADGPLPAGRQSVVWDGRDAEGRPVGSGVYLYRLTQQGYEQTRRMVLLR